MTQPWQGKLIKKDDFRWIIPRDYKPGMRVEGLIYADERMLKQIKQDQAPEQVANVAFLPGIVKNSLAMPDIHWGYGFPIGGVAATDPDKNGVISPGGVGYDINCLPPGTEILSSLGYRLRIEEFSDKWNKEQLLCIDLDKKSPQTCNIVRFIKLRSKKCFRIKTFLGEEIVATEDHPFLTPQGMKELRFIKEGDKVALFPFKGVFYEESGDEVILDEETLKRNYQRLRNVNKGNGYQQLIRHLKKLDLLPLRYSSPKLPYLLKLLGYVFGDGTIYFTNKRGKGQTIFYGSIEDLIKIKDDIKRLGFNCQIYTRQRDYIIRRKDKEYRFNRREASCKVSGTGFALLLVSLGAPVGNKIESNFELPQWLMRARLWQKRLFLASFFGAEMSKPKSPTSHKCNLYAPVITICKKEDYIKSGKKFLNQISKLLKEFGVKTRKITVSIENIDEEDRISYRMRLILSNKPESMLNLYEKIGFEYNQQRTYLANIAVSYLKLKEKIKGIRRQARFLAHQLHRERGWGAQRIYSKLSGKWVNFRFIECSIYSNPQATPRMPENGVSFVEYITQITAGLGNSGVIWDEVTSKEEIAVDDYVYDFTVDHSDHNFIAQGFVVSNCGVRLLRSDLSYDDVKDRIRDIVHAIYITVPAGVGSKGEIRVSHEEEKKLMIKGARWAVEKGYGVKEDLEHCEENGAMEGADPDKVSQRAFERGKAQAGTLGSGNHFLEIQVIDEIYDAEIASKLGLELSMITIMIHTGSRGFGYQICDDYLRVMSHAVQKYGLKLPDRQLACAPINSAEAQNYIKAMRCAANYAWANRQCITYLVRRALERVFNKSWESLGLRLIYDVAHNIAKFEKHKINGEEKILCVHRKGATRAYPPGHPDLPQDYKEIGQPVIIPGDMGRNSYLLVGTQLAMEETFGSTCHGAGRVMSRAQAIKAGKGRSIAQELEGQGIIVMASGKETLSEEMPQAYKDVNDVVRVVHGAGISKKVCRMRPLGVVKG